MIYDAFIFDVDGVLIDTSLSFNKSIKLAVSTATDSSRFNDEHISQLKGITGFNNDWHVAIAGAGWIEWGFGMTFHQYARVLTEMGGGLEAVTNIFSELSKPFQQYVTKLAMEAYGGTTACKTLYGFEPDTIFIEGFWKNETSKITKETVEPLMAISAIVTGRNKAEMDLAFHILGWDLPPFRVAVSDNINLDKPNPTKLINIIKELESNTPIYFGDSLDDYLLVENYKTQTGMQMGFCWVGNENGLINYDFRVDNVMEFFQSYNSPKAR